MLGEEALNSLGCVEEKHRALDSNSTAWSELSTTAINLDEVHSPQMQLQATSDVAGHVVLNTTVRIRTVSRTDMTGA